MTTPASHPTPSATLSTAASTPLGKILASYREAAQSEREKGTYFEELIVCYLRNEASYKELYSDVWDYSQWAKAHPEYNLSAKDTGIDLVAKTHGTNEFHAIQCKCYAEDYRLQKKDIDSFFTASGQTPFTNRIIVSTTNNWSDNAENALIGQQIPVSKIDLHDLEQSQIDWSQYQPNAAPVLKPKYPLRPHQQAALDAVKSGLATADRGKLIMACGTGKTFTSLKIAESLAGSGKRVLFLVPSLSLLSQTLTEWTQQTTTPLHSFAVCSDSEVGKKRSKDDDTVQTFAHELRYPATTKANRLVEAMQKRHDDHHMSVVFSTYHSLSVLHKAQQQGLPEFDLVICDEAHRTTGATFADEDESTFVKIHDNDYLQATKRLYMTATPRIYGDSAKIKQEQGGLTLCSMDDPELYGQELYVINFSEAVQRNLLTDYKVIVLTIDEAHISATLQGMLKDDNNSLKVDDAAKIIGCWKALAKIGLESEVGTDTQAMQRAVAFCQVIEKTYRGKNHKVSSKLIADMFEDVVQAYQEEADLEEADADGSEQGTGHRTLQCEAKHVDGSMNASQKEAKINWLKEQPPADTCRILSNVRCLSEGVDVPALDAVLFLTPRSSQVDVVQSVGRVMRNAPGKQKGYVVLPVVIPAGLTPSEALNDNKVYKVVWEVLQALRSHDDQFDAMINKLDLMEKRPAKMEVIAVTGDAQRKSKTPSKKDRNKDLAQGGTTIGEAPSPEYVPEQTRMDFSVGEIEKALYAKVVKKCGNRLHWEDWANDIAKIARTHITRIQTIIADDRNHREQQAFYAFADELRDDLNDAITNDEVVEMLAQHLITKPVFDALFKDYSFASNNPVSQAMQHVLDILQEHHLEKERDTLERFYASVQMRADGIDNAAGKQKIVVELYDKFFRNAFPKMTERLGIVYTPVEVVDFIIHSIDHLLQQEFSQTLGSKGVHIIDPFTGTGTFITRLLQSGLIKTEQLEHKYQHEIHANEIVLLAYYIAAINIEATYHDLRFGKNDHGNYQPFAGICLTDTFQMYEKDDLISEQLVENSERRMRQKALDIRVIMGNPPYSAGQESANDNNQNVKYPTLDTSIRETYAARSTATNKNALYDSYIRAIRWASNQIGENADGGIIGFVTNAGFVEANTADGLRKCLIEEFSSLYIFHLRGNQRTSGERSRQEGGKIFGSGSRAPIAISLLVKNPQAKQQGQIHFHDIGDYLSQAEKLQKVSDFFSVKGIQAQQWQAIQPDKYGDWMGQRDESFFVHMPIASKKESNFSIFKNHSRGLETSRDFWVYNGSLNLLKSNINKTINFYNFSLISEASKHNVDLSKISWTRGLKKRFDKKIELDHRNGEYLHSMYRPFEKTWVYFSNELNEYTNALAKSFPRNKFENLVLHISGTGNSGKLFSIFLSEVITDLNFQHSGGQCFPLYLYEKAEDSESAEDLFENNEDKIINGYRRKDGISDAGLAHFQAAYPDETISKEDLFYYIYGLLHSEDYRNRYAANLSKELPRIPAVKTAQDFWRFSQAGRELAELHLNYETVAPYPAKVEEVGERDSAKAFYRVEKMKFAKTRNEDNKSVNDLTTLIYNPRITVTGIPLEAYDYVVNGKPALNWVVERQCVKTDKKSGIVNDANDWANETMGNPKYPLELFLRVITVSLETMKIVRALPALDID